MIFRTLAQATRRAFWKSLQTIWSRTIGATPICSSVATIRERTRSSAGEFDRVRTLIAEDEGQPRFCAIGIELAGCAPHGGHRDQQRLGRKRRDQENDEPERQQCVAPHSAPLARADREAISPCGAACDRGGRPSWRLFHGLSGRGRRGDGQCRARALQHPRRAPIPARRGRGRGVVALDRRPDRLRRQRRGAQGQESSSISTSAAGTLPCSLPAPRYRRSTRPSRRLPAAP